MGELVQLLGLLLGALIFIALILVDIRKAVKKGSFWVPGHALVLSALTIQLMNFVEERSALLNRALVEQYSNCTTNVANVQIMNNKVQSTLLIAEDLDKTEALKDILFMVHCSRVMLCVLIAFFLPGMARPGYEEKWTTIAALGFTVFLHIFSELLSVRRRLGIVHLVSYFFYFSNFYQINDVWVILYGAIISGSLVWLLELLICATIANKGIRNITLQRIPFILHNPSAQNSWNAVEDQVFKSWIVARAFYPESIIASSVLATSAALSVAACLLLSIIGWIIQTPLTRKLDVPGFRLKFTITIVEILFSFIGGAIICWRCLTSVVYYGRWRRKEENWRNYFRVEDYWTMQILELQKTEKSLKRLHDDDDKRANQIIGKEGESTRKVPRFLLQCVFRLQWFIVFFSKGFWFLAELVLTNKFLHKVATKILSKHLDTVNTEFKEYEALLCNVSILSETPRSIFLTNRKSIKQAKGIMEKGYKDGQNCRALISFLLKHRRPETCVGIPCLNAETAHDQTRLKFLWKCEPESTLDMERYLIHPGKRSWKLTAVSLIRIVSQIGEDSCDIDGCSCAEYYLKVYQEAWELMDLVEETDPETDSLLSKAADGKFMALRDHKSGQNGQRSASSTTLEEASAAIKGLAEEVKREAEKNYSGQDTPVDWEKLAAGATLYKICISMDCSSGDLKELKKELQSTLAHIIGACIEKVGVALVENSMKWAEEMEERKLLEAVYIAGKSKGLMEKLQPNVHSSPVTEESSMV